MEGPHWRVVEWWLGLTVQRLHLEGPEGSHAGERGVGGGHVDVTLYARGGAGEDASHPAVLGGVRASDVEDGAGVPLGSLGDAVATQLVGLDRVHLVAQRCCQLALIGIDVRHELQASRPEQPVAQLHPLVVVDGSDHEGQAVAVGQTFRYVPKERVLRGLQAVIGDPFVAQASEVDSRC